MSTPGAGISLHQLLRAVVEKGASDLHITTGTPPQLRIDGALLPLKTPPLTPVDTKQLCYSVLSEEQKIAFERDNGGRSFGFTGGHFHRNWGDENFRRLVTNAILWSAKVDVPKGGAPVELDPAELNRNLDRKGKK